MCDLARGSRDCNSFQTMNALKGQSAGLYAHTVFPTMRALTWLSLLYLTSKCQKKESHINCPSLKFCKTIGRQRTIDSKCLMSSLKWGLGRGGSWLHPFQSLRCTACTWTPLGWPCLPTWGSTTGSGHDLAFPLQHARLRIRNTQGKWKTHRFTYQNNSYVCISGCSRNRSALQKQWKTWVTLYNKDLTTEAYFWCLKK